MSNLKLVRLFIIWRAALLISIIPAFFLLPLHPGYTKLPERLTAEYLVNVWANFDGIHYQILAQHWYNTIYTNQLYAFFPLYPASIRLFAPIFGYLGSGLFVSNLSTLLSILLLFKLTTRFFKISVAKTTLQLMAVFPTAFFLVSVYSDSTFLLVSLLTFYFIAKKNYPLACIMAGIASFSRIPGIFLWFSIAGQLFIENKKNFKKTVLDPNIVWLVIPPLGLISYIFYQNFVTGDPLYFVNSQPAFGASRTVDKLILLHQVFYRYLKMMFFSNPLTPTYFTAMIEFSSGIISLPLLYLVYKRLPISYFIYSLGSFILPTLTGTLSSMPRYLIVIFPLFMVAAHWLSTQALWVRKIVYLILVLTSIISISLFSRGYFIG